MITDRKLIAEYDRYNVCIISAIGIFILAVYLFSHSRPIGIAGLYSQMAETIQSNGYLLPRTIPYYTEDGIPFGFPPLSFYIVALINELTGISYTNLAFVYPGVVTTVASIGLYLSATEIFERRAPALFSGIVYVSLPLINASDFTASGVTTGTGNLFFFFGLYAGLRFYKREDERYLLYSLILWAATLMSHPSPALKYVVVFVCLFLTFRRSIRGFVHSSVIGFGGIALASPWWLSVLNTHGVEIYLNTIPRLFSGDVGAELVSFFTSGGGDMELAVIVALSAHTLALFYLCVKGDWFLPVWAVVSLLIGGFTVAITILLLTAFLWELYLPKIRQSTPPIEHNLLDTFDDTLSVNSYTVLFILGIVLFSVASGSAASYIGESSVSPTDQDAMAFIQSETDRNATFVSTANPEVSEWIPYYTKRTWLRSRFGSEWFEQSTTEANGRFTTAMSNCVNTTCVSALLDEYNTDPDFVYISKGSFDASAIHSSDEYSTMYENRGVMVAAIRD